MPEMLDLGGKVLNWAEDLEDNTLQQAGRTARMPFVEPYVALMPDAHLGYGATVGSVIPTRGAIMPAAVGVDIGCGMIAVETDLGAEDLPDSLDPLLSSVEENVPAGVGRAHEDPSNGWWKWEGRHSMAFMRLPPKQAKKAANQFGTLGSGNHFVEVCLDEHGNVWVVLHSGSRGVGNQLAQQHINTAKGLMKERFISLEDPDLAYFVENEPEFQDYIQDLRWAQWYALANREQMMNTVVSAVFEHVGYGKELERINCHHNYTEQENHKGKNLWITRKGAIRMREGDKGVIPGSMGTSSFIVSGLGSESSFTSASHGAGRRMSRGQAKRELDVEEFQTQMQGRTWQAGIAEKLLDEAPDAYKDIHSVMSAQDELVRVDHELTAVLNYKGL